MSYILCIIIHLKPSSWQRGYSASLIFFILSFFGLKILIILQVKGTLSDMFVETLENRRTHWRSTSWRWKHQQEEICQRMMRRIWPQMKLPGIVTVFWRDESFRKRVLGEDTGNVSRAPVPIYVPNYSYPILSSQHWAVMLSSALGQLPALCSRLPEDSMIQTGIICNLIPFEFS